MNVLALLCPSCGAGLRGLGEDRVFPCPACPAAYEVVGEDLRPHPLRLRGDPADLWLPFWSLRCRPRLTIADRHKRGAFSLDDEVEVLVKAFSMIRILQVGNPGLAHPPRDQRAHRRRSLCPRSAPTCTPCQSRCRRSHPR